SHVLGKQGLDPGFDARSDDHTIPVRQAVTLCHVQGAIENSSRREDERKKMAKDMHVLQELGVRELPLLQPAAQLLNEFSQNLPEQECRGRDRLQIPEQLLSLQLFGQFIAVNRV